MTRKRHWIDGPGPWWRNGAWWALIGAVLIGATIALAVQQIWTDIAR
jgi:hypothetical protein